MRARHAFLLPLSVILLSAACSHKNEKTKIAASAPEWVNKGSGAFKDGGTSVFYGVGMMQGTQNRALQVTSADDRARGEIAKTMSTYVAVLGKDYMAATTAGDQTKTSDEQHVEQTLKSFAQFTLHGATIVDHWKDPSDGTLFSLCKLDMASVQKALEESKELDEKVKEHVRANAEKAFDELSKEEAKH